MVWDRTNAESAIFEDITVSPVEFGGVFLWCLKDLKVFKCYFLTPYWRRAFKAMVATFDSKCLLDLLTRTFTVNKSWYRLCTAISILAIGQFRKSFGHFFYQKWRSFLIFFSKWIWRFLYDAILNFEDLTQRAEIRFIICMLRLKLHKF